MASVTAIPARYAKFLTALAGVAIGYLTAYGITWDLQGALVAIGAALAVFGVPNATAGALIVNPIPGIRPPDAPSGAVKVVPPSTGPATDPPAPGGSA